MIQKFWRTNFTEASFIAEMFYNIAPMLAAKHEKVKQPLLLLCFQKINKFNRESK